MVQWFEPLHGHDSVIVLIDEAFRVNVFALHITLLDDCDVLLRKLGLDDIKDRRGVGVRLSLAT